MERRLTEIEGELERELGALLGSVNFSGYADRARLRSDDLAVRAAASRDMLAAKAAVHDAIDAWWNHNVDEPTRDNPFPKPEISKRLRELRAYEESLAHLEVAIRSAVAPDFDAVWNRHADGTAVLQELLRLDSRLITHARSFERSSQRLTLADAQDGFAVLAPSLDELRRVLDERRAFVNQL